MKLMMKCLRNGNHTSSHMYVIFFQMKIRTEKYHYKYRKRVTQKSITTERVTLFHYLSAFP